MGRRLGEGARRARVPRARHHQLGVRVHAGARRTAACRSTSSPSTSPPLDGATELPVSVDLENGYGPEPGDAAAAIERAADAGAVGGSIEDWDPDGALYPLDEARERVAAAVAAARSLPFPFTLTARAENHIRGNPDLDDTIARLTAYEEAGADVLYAPGLRSADEIRAVCAAPSPSRSTCWRCAGCRCARSSGAGAQRVSVGGALDWSAVEGMAAAATRIRDDGDFSGLGGAAQIRDWLRGGS